MKIIVKEIKRVVPYTFDIESDEYIPTDNMNAEFQGVEVIAELEPDGNNTVLLMPTRGSNKTRNINLLFDLQAE